jgi:hypothetical protein
MVAYFAAAPMVSDDIEPLFWSVSGGRKGRDVVARGLVLWVFEGRGIAADTDDGLNMREVDFERVGGNDGYVPIDNTAVVLFCVGKRGERFLVWAIVRL